VRACNAASVPSRCTERGCGCRGYSRNNDKDQLLEKKARLDAENRRQVMLTVEELKRELLSWVSHDSRWMTFKAWVEGVLFESKLANMCLKPKVIDDEYLKPDEQELLRRFAPEYSLANPPVLTHMYDTVRLLLLATSTSLQMCSCAIRQCCTSTYVLMRAMPAACDGSRHGPGRQSVWLQATHQEVPAPQAGAS
jgi:hypothetical protein